MACVRAPHDAPCAYRERYGCTSGVRARGLEEGLCVIEQAARHAERAEWMEIAAFVPAERRSEFLDLADRWLDATLYLSRAATWSSIVWSATTPSDDLGPGSEVWKSNRYVEAGLARRWRIGPELFAMRARAERARDGRDLLDRVREARQPAPPRE